MKFSIQRPIRNLLCLALATTLATTAHATVTNIAWYRLGENDPGAASGLAVTNTTTDIIGTNHLKQFGSPLYTNNVSAAAASQLGSSLAIQFNGTSQYLSNAVVSTVVGNFGIEAWVKPNTTNAGNHIIAYNGSTTANGWGIMQNGINYNALLGGKTSFGNGTVVTGAWAHVALVRDGNTSTLYVNGVDQGSVSGGASTPLTPDTGFAIGGHPQSPAGEFFSGAIDEVRVFTFGGGQFSTNDLLLNLQFVATLPASNVAATSATLNGSANPSGLPTSGWFQWGTTTNFGNTTTVQAVGNGSGNTNFSQSITGLFGGTYNFRAVASNSVGVFFGTNQSFSTPVFTLAVTNLPGFYAGFSQWGDYDNDGRLDILLSGEITTNSASDGQIWRNTGAGFTLTNIPDFTNRFPFAAALGDYDNDGRLDAMIFLGDGSIPIERNTGSGFAFTNVGLTNTSFDVITAWGDYDNDGRPDVLIANRVWRNTGSGFVDIKAGLPSFNYNCSVAWGDYDNDGRLDILFAGNDSGFSGGICQVWRNTGVGFTNINAGLPNLIYPSVAWGDFDNDGRLDILLTGLSGGTLVSQVWRNTGSGFTNINAGLPGVFRGSIAWGDYDNDGLLDILITGTTNSTNFAAGAISQIWRNTGNGFTNINAGLPGVFYSSVAWGDYDNDGRLDILLSGRTSSDQLISQVWRNNTPTTNTPPSAPTGLAVTFASNIVTFGWNAASDAQTPPGGLTYNLRVGTTPGGFDIVSPTAASSGFRRLPQMGNRQATRFWPTTILPLSQPIYWSVQAIDGAFAGGQFAAEQHFTVAYTFAPTNGIPVPGDTNGDGIVSQSELAAVLANLNGNGIVSGSDLGLVVSNYWHNNALGLTNVALANGTNFQFWVSNLMSLNLNVEVSTNLSAWQYLAPALLFYQVSDPGATNTNRFYRLVTP